MTTYDATYPFCPDSLLHHASSMAGGEKTLSGVISDVAKERPLQAGQ